MQEKEAMASRLKSVVALIGVVFIIWGSAKFIMPFLNSEGLVTDGEFREIRIGASKADVAGIVTGMGNSPRSLLRLSGYADEDAKYCPLVFNHCSLKNVNESNRWYLSYPGFHNERLEVSFSDDRVVAIRYSRAPFDP